MWRSQASPLVTSPGGFSKLPLLLLVKQVLGAVRERAKQPGQAARSRGWRHSRFRWLCQMCADPLPCVGTKLGERIPATAEIPQWFGAWPEVPFRSLRGMECSQTLVGQSRSPMVGISMLGFWAISTQMWLHWLWISWHFLSLMEQIHVSLYPNLLVCKKCG